MFACYCSEIANNEQNYSEKNLGYGGDGYITNIG